MSSVLVDTSVWIDHLRRSNAAFAERLHRGQVYCHPLVIGELACGVGKNRQRILNDLANLPPAVVAEDEEVLSLIELHGLAGSGIGWIDAHLLASARLTPLPLWTLDRAAADAARALGVLAQP